MLKEDGLSWVSHFDTHAFAPFFYSFFLLSLSLYLRHFSFRISEPKPHYCAIFVCGNAYIRFDQHSKPLHFWPLFNYTFPLCKCRATKEWLNIRSLLDFTSLGLFSFFFCLLFFCYSEPLELFSLYVTVFAEL